MNSGMIADSPPRDTMTSVRTPSTTAFFSTASKYLYAPAMASSPSGPDRQRQGDLARLRFRYGDRDRLDQPRARRRGGVPQVPCHHHHAGKDEHAAKPA